MEVLRREYFIPFLTSPPLPKDLVQVPSYSPGSVKGRALEGEIQVLIAKGAVKPASQSLGFYSRVFVVMKTSGT